MKFVRRILLFIFAFLFPIIVYANDDFLKEIKVKESSQDIMIGTSTINQDVITPTIGFLNTGDFVSYEFLVDYDTKLYDISSISDTNHNNNIKTNYSYNENRVYMTIIYDKEVNGSFQFDNYDINIKLVGKKSNPQTGQFGLLFIVFLYCLLILILVILSKKKTAIKVGLLIFAIPLFVFAKETNNIKITINTSKINIAYKINFEGNGSTGGSMSSIVCLPDQECTLPVNTYQNGDSVFMGWAMSPNGTVAFSNDQEAYNYVQSGNNNVTLYAVWKKYYTVHFNGNGSSSGSMSDIRCGQDDLCTIPTNAYQKSGSTFSGWATSSGGSASYYSGSSYTNITSSSEITLYAVWITVSNKTYSYSGGYQTYTIPATGRYKLQVWGAQGGTGRYGSGGKGGYSVGTISLTAGTVLYVYVGGQGQVYSSHSSNAGYNGGGSTNYIYSSGGGGATDIRIGSTSLYARVIVAGGGAGVGNSNCAVATYGYGGGTSGGGGTSQGKCGTQASGGTQTAGGTGGLYKNLATATNGGRGTSGSFGLGGSNTNSTEFNSSGGGGGGWYGGGAGAKYGWASGGGGGSGYVYTSSTASNYPSGCLLNSSYYLTDASTYAGNTSFTSTSGGTETGHTGNGYAKISYLGS